MFNELKEMAQKAEGRKTRGWDGRGNRYAHRRTHTTLVTVRDFEPCTALDETSKTTKPPRLDASVASKAAPKSRRSRTVLVQLYLANRQGDGAFRSSIRGAVNVQLEADHVSEIDRLRSATGQVGVLDFNRC